MLKFHREFIAELRNVAEKPSKKQIQKKIQPKL